MERASELGRLFDRGFALVEELPPPPKLGDRERTISDAIRRAIAASAFAFFEKNRLPLYRALTSELSKRLRVDELVWEAAERWPGLLPSHSQVQEENDRLQRDKLGREVLQGIFVGQVLSEEESGKHLLQSMSLPTKEATMQVDAFVRSGSVNLATASVAADKDAGWITFECPDYLNAEDLETVHDFETAVDLVLLHPGLKLGILRGGRVSHPKYAGRRIFSSGINLTKLYHGKIPFLFYLVRDLGVVHKIFRGLSESPPTRSRPPSEIETTLEKLWLAVVDGFAIGGGCQILLVVDYVIAEEGAYFNLPARKEGIIPGAANLRLPRFLGERLARQAILFDKKFSVDSEEAAGLVAEVHPPHELDSAIERIVTDVSGSGLVSASGNRKALRHATESLDQFRAYMATYAVEQAFCHFSSDLVRNLETHWQARSRGLKD
jgi:thioesterase DpgC